MVSFDLRTRSPATTESLLPVGLSVNSYMDILRPRTPATGSLSRHSENDYSDEIEYSENWDSVDSTRNILLYPINAGTPRNGVLAALRGGLVTDTTLRARVSAIVGPGATLTGIAETLRPLYVTAATAGQPAPTVAELTRAIAVYSRFYLTMRTMAHYEDGLRIPLPIEIDPGSGDWILNSNTSRLWARSFQAAWQPQLIRRPARLPLPDPDNLPAAVQRFLAANRTLRARGVHLQARAVTNPFKAVLFIFEAFRALGANAFPVALEFLDQSVNHQLQLLATLTAGQGILRRLSMVLGHVPGGTTRAQQQSLARGRSMLDRAMRPGGNWVARRELPETPQQRADRGAAMGGWQIVHANEPVGGRHRMVLGHDISAGRIGPWHNFRGPAYGGRISPTDFINTHAALLNPAGNARLADRLNIVRAIVVNEGFLDAVRLRDSAIVSLGIQQWSAHVNNELFSLLMRYKTMAPDEFMLFFELQNFDVTAVGNSFRMQRIQANDNRVIVNSIADRRNFFGGAVVGGITRYGTEWSARLRMPAVATLNYRAAQVLEAAARFDRISAQINPITVNGVAAPVPLTTLITSELGVALILDAHINRPGYVQADLQNAANAAGPQADDNARDQAITRAYRNIRRTHNTPQRNANIALQGLDANHGTFNGW